MTLQETLQAGGIPVRYIETRGVFVRAWLLREPRKWTLLKSAGDAFGLTFAGWGKDSVEGHYVSYQRRNRS
jgi:hypothetical protein